MEDERRKRIKRIRICIVSIIGCAILAPVILCIVLAVMNGNLSKRLSEAETLLSIQGQRLRELEEISENADDDDATGEKENPYGSEALHDESGQTDLDEPYCIYLTFDDGPSENTEEILSILRAYDVKATFFVNGRTDEDSLMLYEQIAQAGHTVGMHSYSHRYASVYASDESFISDLDRISNLILNTTGRTPHLYRFPGGSSNKATSRKKILGFIKLLQERNIEYVDWNIDSMDAKGTPITAAQIVKNVFSNFGQYHTNVVLMHDGAGHAETVKALPLIIERARNMGAKLLPITEDTELVKHL